MSQPAPADKSRSTVGNPLHPELPAARQSVVWKGLYGDSIGLSLATTIEKAPGPTLVVVADMREADAILANLKFFTTSPETELALLPDWETLPYDLYSPHPDIVSQRLLSLYRLRKLKKGAVVVSMASLMHLIAPPDYVAQNGFLLATGDTIDLEAVRLRFETAGYRCVSQVMEHGEFAVRGSLLDLYPMGSELPYRIDLFDDEVETIRTFDPENQRSLERVENIHLLPARECPLDDASVSRFRGAYRKLFEGDPQRSLIYRDVSQGNAPGGIEYYLPLFFEKPATLFDYMPASTTIITLPGTPDLPAQYHEQMQSRYEERRHDVERPLLPPESLILNPAELHERIANHASIHVSSLDTPIADKKGVVFNSSVLPDVGLKIRATEPAADLSRFIESFPGRILITAESEGRQEMLREQLSGYGIRTHLLPAWASFLESDTGIGLTIAALEHGAVLDHPSLAIIPESRLFGEKVRQQRRRRPARDADTIIQDLTDLVEGAPVVHEDHGVGRYQGMNRLNVGGIDTEFLTLEYAGGDKLYVPVSSLQRISRYTGASANEAPLHKLGGEQWQRARRRASEKVRDVAAELLEIYARRAARLGHSFPVEGDDYATFAGAFPFEETPDQETTINSVLEDLMAPKPMDRVVCGDVGFGKTEVAMRAAFVAAQAGRQVAVLVPTTLLAQQHYQNFCDRFAQWPIRIEVLSRFRSKAQQEQVLAGLLQGTVDIVIGTHKLLQGSIKFRELGLVIVDEEHRFGVRQKEKLKSLRSEVDLLTLTATPIPRTLNMSLSGLRDLSIIATPPVHRLAVKTFVGQWHKPTVREACLREIKRGGQVYFLHNKVESIERMARDIGELMPEAKIEIAHGQMRERELEQVMLDFYHRRFNILVCTTIIESGIDVPTANTIIINRADKLGLAQLHQLRGRVGRSHHLAYAYLVVPPRNIMSADAIKRLEAVESLKTIGAGFTLASHDLEIRGAGELLGDEQSGQIHEIGFSMYMELLERAVADLKAGRQPELDRPLDHGPEIDLHLPALIPNDYLPDVHSRLTLYKRIAAAQNSDALRELQVEMIDRFGLMPSATKNLFHITELKLQAQPLGVQKIDAHDSQGRLIFNAKTHVDPMRIVELVQSRPDRFSLQGSDTLRFYANMDEPEDRINAVANIIRTIAPESENVQTPH